MVTRPTSAAAASAAITGMGATAPLPINRWFSERTCEKSTHDTTYLLLRYRWGELSSRYQADWQVLSFERQGRERHYQGPFTIVP